MLLSSLLLLCAASVLVATQLPVGTHLEIRMRQGLHSYSAKAGTPIEAVVIAPVLVGGATVIPPGAIVRGQVREVTKVGLGLIHERASILIEFNALEMPGGETIAIEAPAKSQRCRPSASRRRERRRPEDYREAAPPLQALPNHVNWLGNPDG